MRPLLDYADIYSGFAGYEPDGRAYHYSALSFDWRLQCSMNPRMGPGCPTIR